MLSQLRCSMHLMYCDRSAGLGSMYTDPSERLPAGTLPEALPEARASVMLQNLGVAPNSITVS